MKIFRFFLILIISIQTFAQKVTNGSQGYQVTIATKNLKAQKLLLFMKYGVNNQVVISDSLTIKTNDQKVVFKKNQNLLGVIYFLKLASQPQEIMLALDNGTQASLELYDANVENINCVQSNLNKDFIAYQRLKKTENSSVQLKILRNTLLPKYPKSIVNLYLRIEDKILENAPSTIEEKIKFNHSFFTTIDKSDQRIYLLPNINQYLYAFTISTPVTDDYYKKNIDYVLKGMDCKSRNYQVYARWFLSNLSYFESFNLDQSFNHLFKNYIESNSCKLFSDSELVTFRTKSITNTLLPNYTKLPSISFVDKENKTFSLETSYANYDYTFLAFFSPSCHHCQQTMPIASSTFAALKLKYPNKKIQLITVLNDADESQWQQFIAERKLSGWLNLKSDDPKRKYQSELNAFSNPNFFLVDSKGHIHLKSFNPKAIEEIFLKKI